LVGASLYRCCNKPVISAASLAIGTDSLHESSNPSWIAIVFLRLSCSFSNDYVPTWLLHLPAVYFSAKIAALRQSAFVHKEFLERGQEVSRDLFLTGRRNFS
jgi:hypothetical protein